MADDIVVTDEPDRQSYVARRGQQEIGRAEYEIIGDTVVFTHTEVDPAVEGQGVGSILARFAYDDVARQGGMHVVAACPFMHTWLERHPDYQHLVDASRSSGSGP